MKKRIPIHTAVAILATTSIAAGISLADEKKDTQKVEPTPRAEKKEEAKPRQKNAREADRPERAGASDETEKQTWLGVATTPIPGNLREYLGLAEGFGIQIRQVVEDSPAAEAGVLDNDVMTKLDDQKLTSPEHLAVLVRAMKGGDKVKITVIRKGQEQTLEATLGATDRPLRSPMMPGTYDRGSRPMHGYLRDGDYHNNTRDLQDAARHFQDHWENWMKENRSQRPEPRTDEKNEKSSEPKRDSEKSQPSQRTPAISVNPGFPLKIFGMKGIVKIDNEEGELTITNTDEGHSISIINREGEEVYEGPFDPEKGAESLPAEAREQLEKMKLENLDVLPMPPLAEDTEVEEAADTVVRKTEKGPVL